MIIELDPPIFGESIESGLPVVALFLIREEGVTFFTVQEMDGRISTMPEGMFLGDARWSPERGWHDPKQPRPEPVRDLEEELGE